MKKVFYNLSQIIELSDNDSEFIKLMVATFITEMSSDLDALTVAVLKEDRANVHGYAQKMKPSLELFGLKGHHMALKLESSGESQKKKDIQEDFMYLHQELEETLIQLKRDF
jgi:HPt (histidine-containing phosphotransfer) domain-containing protein